MGNAKILIVDDEVFIRELVVDFLEGENLILETAGSLSEAEKKINEQDFDLILLDWNLNGGNSAEIINKVKKEKKASFIILLTGDHSLDIDEIRCEVVRDIIHKPFQMDDFLEKIERTMEK